MIKVERPKGSTPKGLVRKGLAELKKHRDLDPKDRKFKAYSDDLVKEKLAELFGRKCMFCESLLAGSQPGDVEHYRPKGKVVICPKTKDAPAQHAAGYYWLAAKWPNLLLSCADCNRPRTQDDCDGNARVIGKANFFPLADETKRASGPWFVFKEEPLLLNPCIDDPADHLVFLDDGRVQARLIDGAPSRKGEASIYYLGLARAELLQMRARHARMVRAAIRHTVDALEEHRDPGADLEDLVAFLDPKEAYVGFSRMLINKYMGKYIAALNLHV
ncbi:hypothetical protein LOY24_14200 [Pseudomonas putida]|uniref:hypothetical protein n=1 Tax=Pseudomonas putida TaxID=303 RepID=UPI002160F38A|nr:hypothetical protein [Pseudomonas putida]UVL75890.1 hypothetical protein LOY24_14200 [Pseudomonas putida]